MKEVLPGWLMVEVEKGAVDLSIEGDVFAYRVWLLGGISCSWYSQKLPQAPMRS